MTRLPDIISDTEWSSESLSEVINNQAEALLHYFNATHGYLFEDREKWYELTLRRKTVLRGLDYSNRYVRSFIVSLLDLACRFEYVAMVQTLITIVTDNGILIGKRLEAECRIFSPRPSHSRDIISRFPEICELLEEAREDGADTKEIKSALLSFYRYALGNLAPDYVDRLKQAAGQLPIAALIKTELEDQNTTAESLTSEIDNLLRRNDAPIVAHDHGPHMIEDGTDYAADIQAVDAAFRDIRNLAKSHAPIDTTLEGRGKEIIDNVSDLAVYLSNYGNMHFAKMMSAFEPPFPPPSDKIDLIDWGCGQGIASMAFIEKFGSEKINLIVLIDPSEHSLRRAALHCRKLAPEARIITKCAGFDNLQPGDLPRPTCDTAVNLFSNVLDMKDFSQKHLIDIIETTMHRRNYFACVSPALDETSIALLDSFMQHFAESYESFNLYHNETNTKTSSFWMCNNQYYYGVRIHGSNDYCSRPYSSEGCRRKWTRDMRVFSV